MTNTAFMSGFYKQQIEKLKAKVIAHAKLGNELKVAMLEKEIANYEKALRSNGG